MNENYKLFSIVVINNNHHLNINGKVIRIKIKKTRIRKEYYNNFFTVDLK